MSPTGTLVTLRSPLTFCSYSSYPGRLTIGYLLAGYRGPVIYKYVCQGRHLLRGVPTLAFLGQDVIQGTLGKSSL